MDVYQKKQEHLQAGDPNDLGDAWVWRAIALPSRLRVVHHLSHQRRGKEASIFLAKFKARTDGRPPLFTSDKLPAYVDALIANYSTPEPPPVNRGPGRPRKHSRRVLDPELCYAQVDKRRQRGRVVGSSEGIKASVGAATNVRAPPDPFSPPLMPAIISQARHLRWGPCSHQSQRWHAHQWGVAAMARRVRGSRPTVSRARALAPPERQRSRHRGPPQAERHGRRCGCGGRGTPEDHGGRQGTGRGAVAGDWW
jgi:hypothetical protein